MTINQNPDAELSRVDSLLEITHGVTFKPFASGATVQVYILTSPDVASPNPQLLSKYDEKIAKKPDGTYKFTAIQGQPLISRIQTALDSISGISNINFVVTTNPAHAATAGIRIGLVDFIDWDDHGAQMSWVDGGVTKSDIFIRNGPIAEFGSGEFLYFTLLHELGHALGLDHPSEQTSTTDIGNSSAVSVMSYADWVGPPEMEFYAHQGMTPLLLDVAALQRLYGVKEKNSGDTTYHFDNRVLSDEEKLNSAVGNAEFNLYMNQTRVLWDTGGDEDTLDASTYEDRVDIYLESGFLSSIGGEKISALRLDQK